MTRPLTNRHLNPTLASLLRAAALVCALVLPPTVQADLSFNDGRTRLILDGRQQRWPVNIVNLGKEPALMQLSLNWGDKRDTRNIPLAISNPLLLIQPGQRKSIEIFYQGHGLPDDRETYLLLDVLKLPDAAESGTNQLQIAPLHHFKVFYRPLLERNPARAAAEVSWKLLTEQGSPKALLANPSPYHVTFTDIEPLDARHQPCAPPTIHLMLAPFSEQTLALDCKQPPTSVDYQAISDGGSSKEQRARLSSSNSHGEVKP